ncbi:MAG: dCTP deaminase [archaeon]|nr:dCTP deaminase [archaeon]
MILSKTDIKRYVAEKRLKIEPFNEDLVQGNGVDLRLGNQIARLKPSKTVFDTRSTQINYEDFFTKEVGDSFLLVPQERILVHTLETIELDNSITGFVNLRSSYARIGLSLPPAAIDAGFKGQLTLEVIGGSFPIKLYAKDRFCHIALAKLTSDSVRYRGVYLGQRGVTYPKF